MEHTNKAIVDIDVVGIKKYYSWTKGGQQMYTSE